ILFYFFFFFQAEDGIRDFHVTGVQTCALPICWKKLVACWAALAPRSSRQQGECRPAGHQLFPARAALAHYDQSTAGGLAAGPVRSEERRVGKEWRSLCVR